MKNILCAGLLALGTVAMAPLLAADTSIKPGRYDSLMLAVTPDHQIQGYYLEELGEGVSRRCSFYLKGWLEDTGPSQVSTWLKQAFAGQIAAADDGIVLSVPRAREHPGCMSVLPPEIANGLELGIIAERPWIGLVRVAADKAYMVKSPGDKDVKRPYIIKNDVVGVLEYKDGWARVEYINADDHSFTGWIRSEQYSALTQPGQ